MLIAFTKRRLLSLTRREWGEHIPEFHLPRLGVVDKKALAIASEIRNELLTASFFYEESIESLLTFFWNTCSSHIQLFWSQSTPEGKNHRRPDANS